MEFTTLHLDNTCQSNVLNLLSRQLVAESVDGAYLPCEHTAGDETVTGEFNIDDWKQIGHHDGNGTKHRSEILRQLLTACHTLVLQSICTCCHNINGSYEFVLQYKLRQGTTTLQRTVGVRARRTEADSLQATLSINPPVGCNYCPQGPRLPSQLQIVTALDR